MAFDIETVIAEMGELIPRGGDTGDELSERARDVDDERRIAAALAGRVTDWQGKNGDKYRNLIERMIAGCPRVAGCTWTTLKREAALADGTLTLGDVAELRRKYERQRETDRIVEEFPDFQDDGRYR